MLSFSKRIWQTLFSIYSTALKSIGSTHSFMPLWYVIPILRFRILFSASRERRARRILGFDFESYFGIRNLSRWPYNTSTFPSLDLYLPVRKYSQGNTITVEFNVAFDKFVQCSLTGVWQKIVTSVEDLTESKIIFCSTLLDVHSLNLNTYAIEFSITSMRPDARFSK